jgi:hypothetical protein
MQKISALLVVAMLSGLFHLAAMPMEVVEPQASHACEEGHPKQSAAAKAATCVHTCCLAIETALTPLAIARATVGSGLDNPVVSTLLLENHAARLFKPPKFTLPS